MAVAENNNKRLYIDTQQASSSSSSSPSSLSTYYRYEVTTGSLSEKTKYCYTHHINEFLAYFKITDITPLHEFTPKVIKQMVKDYVIHLRDVRKSARSSINVAVAAD